MTETLSNREYVTRHRIPERDVAFSEAEYAERLRRVCEEMQRHRIDVLFVSSPEGMYYLSGYLSEWYQAQSPTIWPPASGIAVHADTATTMHFETAMDEVLARYTSVSPDIRVHRDTRVSMIEFITAELKGARWLNGTVGLEMSSYRPNRRHSEQFESALVAAGAKVMDATSIMRDVRRIKSTAELDYLRKAAGFADIGMTAARDALAVGATELDVYAEMTYAMYKAGGEPAAIFLPVASGRRTAATHGLSLHKKIEAGEMVVIDICGVSRRYHANVSRTFAMGEPHPTVAAHVNKSAAIFDNLPAIVRPHMRVEELTQFVREYFLEHGLWQDRAWIGGYELGIAIPPDWDGPFTYDADVNQGDATLEPGMVVNLESTVYLPEGAGKSMVINTLMFTESQVSILSNLANGLHTVA